MNTTRLVAIGAALAIGAGGLAACENRSAVEADPANTETVGDGTTSTGEQLKEEAAQVGDAIGAAAKEAAQEIDQATDKMAEEAQEAEADTAAEASQDNAGKK